MGSARRAHRPRRGGGGGRAAGAPLTLCPAPQEHPFFTLHKAKETDIAAFVTEILGEDS